MMFKGVIKMAKDPKYSITEEGSRTIITYQKDEETHVFRYETGDTGRLIEMTAEKAKDITSNFDWFDSAVIALQLGNHQKKK